MGYANSLRDITNRALERRPTPKIEFSDEPDREISKEEFYSYWVDRLYAKAQSELFVVAELCGESARVYVVQGDKDISEHNWEILIRLEEKFEDEGFETEHFVTTGTSLKTGDFKDAFLIVSW